MGTEEADLVAGKGTDKRQERELGDCFALNI